MVSSGATGTNSTAYSRAAEAADAIRTRLGPPDVAVVLGSGWGGDVERFGAPMASMQLAAVPGVPAPTVVGHHGSATMVDRHGRAVLVLAGRSHLYEGHDVHTVVHTVRAAVLAGAGAVVLTNAAGGLRTEWSVGTPVLICDQLNLSGANPMCGEPPPESLPSRFCDLSDLYDASWRQRLRDHNDSGGLPEGVYAGMLGGSYETPAEIRMLAALGADLVGMSTVLEAIAVRHLGASVAGISLVTNLAAGLGGALSHDEVLDAADAAKDRLANVLGAAIDTAPSPRDDRTTR